MSFAKLYPIANDGLDPDEAGVRLKFAGKIHGSVRLFWPVAAADGLLLLQGTGANGQKLYGVGYADESGFLRGATLGCRACWCDLVMPDCVQIDLSGCVFSSGSPAGISLDPLSGVFVLHRQPAEYEMQQYRRWVAVVPLGYGNSFYPWVGYVDLIYICDPLAVFNDVFDEIFVSCIWSEGYNPYVIHPGWLLYVSIADSFVDAYLHPQVDYYGIDWCSHHDAANEGPTILNGVHCDLPGDQTNLWRQSSEGGLTTSIPPGNPTCPSPYYGGRTANFVVTEVSDSECPDPTPYVLTVCAKGCCDLPVGGAYVNVRSTRDIGPVLTGETSGLTGCVEFHLSPDVYRVSMAGPTDTAECNGSQLTRWGMDPAEPTSKIVSVFGSPTVTWNFLPLCPSLAMAVDVSGISAWECTPPANYYRSEDQNQSLIYVPYSQWNRTFSLPAGITECRKASTPLVDGVTVLDPNQNCQESVANGVSMQAVLHYGNTFWNPGEGEVIPGHPECRWWITLVYYAANAGPGFWLMAYGSEDIFHPTGTYTVLSPLGAGTGGNYESMGLDEPYSGASPVIEVSYATP